MYVNGAEANNTMDWSGTKFPISNETISFDQSHENL